MAGNLAVKKLPDHDLIEYLRAKNLLFLNMEKPFQIRAPFQPEMDVQQQG